MPNAEPQRIVNVESALSRPGDSGEYAEHLKKIQADGRCPFCPERLHEEHKNPIIDENDNWVLTNNMYPAKGSEHHLLAIHKGHIEQMGLLTDKAWVNLRAIMLGEVAARRLVGGTFLMRFGDTAVNGGSVAHLHAQLISGPRTEGSKPVLTRVG